MIRFALLIILHNPSAYAEPPLKQEREQLSQWLERRTKESQDAFTPIYRKKIQLRNQAIAKAIADDPHLSKDKVQLLKYMIGLDFSLAPVLSTQRHQRVLFPAHYYEELLKAKTIPPQAAEAVKFAMLFAMPSSTLYGATFDKNNPAAQPPPRAYLPPKGIIRTAVQITNDLQLQEFKHVLDQRRNLRQGAYLIRSGHPVDQNDWYDTADHLAEPLVEVWFNGLLLIGDGKDVDRKFFRRAFHMTYHIFRNDFLTLYSEPGILTPEGRVPAENFRLLAKDLSNLLAELKGTYYATIGHPIKRQAFVTVLSFFNQYFRDDGLYYSTKDNKLKREAESKNLDRRTNAIRGLLKIIRQEITEDFQLEVLTTAVLSVDVASGRVIQDKRFLPYLDGRVAAPALQEGRMPFDHRKNYKLLHSKRQSWLCKTLNLSKAARRNPFNVY